MESTSTLPGKYIPFFSIISFWVSVFVKAQTTSQKLRFANPVSVSGTGIQNYLGCNRSNVIPAMSAFIRTHEIKNATLVNIDDS